MSAYPPPASGNDIVFNPLNFKAADEFITLANADRRYLKLSGGNIVGSLEITGGLGLNGSPVLVQQAGILNLVTTASNGITLNQTNPNLTSNILFRASTGIADMEFGLRGSGASNAGDIYIWKGGFRLTFANSNNLCRIYGALTADGHFRAPLLGLGNNLPTTLTRDITILESSSDPDIVIGRTDTNTNAFRISYTHVGDGNALNRLVIAPIGATSNQTMTFTANGRVGIGSPTPTQAFEVLGNINVSSSYLIGGNNIDDRYLRTTSDTTSTAVVRFYASQSAGGPDQTIIRFGHTVAAGDWFLRHHRSSGGVENNCLELLNTNSNLLGMSIGSFNGLGVGDGCMLVMNGIQGDTGLGFIRASSVNCNGALHLNCGIPQSVPANRRYGSSTSDPSNQSGGIVSISMYAYNNLWVRGDMYCTSDRRMKTNIRPWGVGEKAMGLLNVDPVWYSWKDDESQYLHLGFIAQDLLKHDCGDLVQAFKNTQVTEPCLETDTPKDVQLVVDYQKVPLYLLEIIKRQQQQIETMSKQIYTIVGLLPPKKREIFHDSI
jgi:hypothetical protein